MTKIIFSILFSICLISQSFADSITITAPTHGGTIIIPAGQSSINVQVCWEYQSDEDVSFSLSAEGQIRQNVTSCYTVENVSYGSKHWSLKMEKSNGGYTTTSVDFTVELTTISLTADNNFIAAGGLNNGKLYVDDAEQTAPYNITKNRGASLKLEAISPQADVDGYQEIWNTGNTNRSEWRKNGAFAWYDQAKTFNLVSSDNGSEYEAQFRKIIATTSGTLSTNETWFTPITLTGDVSVPAGKSLTINSDASVSLNGHSIISTGGTINKENDAEIDAAAYITETGILKGLCPTIQAALTNAPSSGCFVEIQPGTYSENVSISNKSYLTVTGNESSTNLTGNMSFYSCPDLYISSINSKNVTLSNCASPNIYHTVNGSGTDGGIHLFDCTDFQRTGEVSNAAYGLSANGGNGYIYGTASFYSNDVAVNSSNSSDIVLEYSQLCGNITTDLYAITGGDIYAYECYYNNATPRIYEYLNGNVDVSGVRDCGLMKRGSETEFPTSIIPDNLKTDDPEALAYLTLKNEYYKLFRKIKDDIKLLGVFHKDKFRNEHISIIKSYKAFLNKYPNSKYSKNALTAAAKSFWRYDDYPGMKKFLDDVLADKEMASLKGTAENLFVDYYRDIKDFDKAIKQADYISEEYGYDENLVCGAMYNKALMLAHDLNKPDEAVACLRNIIKNYPENGLKQFAENELIVLGVEKETKPASSESGELEFATSSYPNPFNPSTTISYQLPKDGMVTLKIYDAIGREVKTLVDEFKQKGKYSINFNASELASGVYFYRINVNGFSVSKKLMLLK